MKKSIFFDDDEYSHYTHPDRPENIESRCLRLLSELVVTGITPHINLYIADFICKKDEELARYIFTELADGNVSNLRVQLLGIPLEKPWEVKKKEDGWETFFNTETEETVNILPFNPNQADVSLYFKVLFFQFLSAMAVIFAKYPMFRHNDLKIDNVLFSWTGKKRFHPPNGKVYKYVVGGETFIVPDVGFQVKLWDFDAATLPGLLDNEKVITSPLNSAMGADIPNQYYDIHLFFNQMNNANLPRDAIEFIETIVPSDSGRFETNKYDRLKDYSLEYTTPAKLLKSEYFDEFRLKDYHGPFKESYGEPQKKIYFPPPLTFTMPDGCLMYPDSVFFQRKDGKPETLLMNQVKHARCPLADQEAEDQSELFATMFNTIGKLYKMPADELEKLVVQTTASLQHFLSKRVVPLKFIKKLWWAAVNYTLTLQKGERLMSFPDLTIIIDIGVIRKFSQDDVDIISDPEEDEDLTYHQFVDTYKQWAAFEAETYFEQFARPAAR